MPPAWQSRRLPPSPIARCGGLSAMVLSGPMSLTKYSEIITALTQLDPWLRGLGINPCFDRVHHALETVKKAQEGTRQFIATGKSPHVQDPSELTFGITEALEFYDVFNAFRTEPERILAPMLDRALSGPFHPANETCQNSDGRNIMFELALGAEWRQRGLDVAIGESGFDAHDKRNPIHHRMQETNTRAQP